MKMSTFLYLKSLVLVVFGNFRYDVSIVVTILPRKANMYVVIRKVKTRK